MHRRLSGFARDFGRRDVAHNARECLRVEAEIAVCALSSSLSQRLHIGVSQALERAALTLLIEHRCVSGEQNIIGIGERRRRKSGVLNDGFGEHVDKALCAHLEVDVTDAKLHAIRRRHAVGLDGTDAQACSNTAHDFADIGLDGFLRICRLLRTCHLLCNRRLLRICRRHCACILLHFCQLLSTCRLLCICRFRSDDGALFFVDV